MIDLAGQHGLTGFVYAGLTAHGKGLVPVYYPEDKDLVSATLLGKEIQTLSPEEMLIHLCIHATSHCWDRLEWLAKAGYTHENWRVLKTDLKKLILSTEALPIENAEYGQMYEIRGEISGPNGNSLDVCTIWMTEFATGITKFITMYPDKRR